MKRKTKIRKYLNITLSGPQEEWGRNSHPLWTSHRERTWVSELKLGRISYGKEVKHWDKVLREVGNDSSLCSRDNAFNNILYLLDSFEIVGQLDWMNMHISSNANILFHSVWFLLQFTIKDKQTWKLRPAITPIPAWRKLKLSSLRQERHWIIMWEKKKDFRI